MMYMLRYNPYEKQTVIAMIQLYCRLKHGRRNTVCAECDEMIDYSVCRLKNCRYGKLKPVCGKCSGSCYVPDKQKQIKKNHADDTSLDAAIPSFTDILSFQTSDCRQTTAKSKKMITGRAKNELRSYWK
jgi:hypothetical protein